MTAVCFINLADISVGGTVHIHVCHLWNDSLLVFIEILIGSCCIYKEKNNLEDFLQIFVIDVSICMFEMLPRVSEDVRRNKHMIILLTKAR